MGYGVVKSKTFFSLIMREKQLIIKARNSSIVRFNVLDDRISKGLSLFTFSKVAKPRHRNYSRILH